MFGGGKHQTYTNKYEDRSQWDAEDWDNFHINKMIQKLVKQGYGPTAIEEMKQKAMKEAA